MSSLFLSHFDFKIGRFERDQASALRQLASMHAEIDSSLDALRIEKLMTRFGCKPGQINYRSSDLPDFSPNPSNERKLFRDLEGKIKEPHFTERMNFYSKSAEKTFEEFYPESHANPPDHLIHVTCTGYESPSAPQKLISNRNWEEKTVSTQVYHMGCYAAFPALRIARGFLNHSSTVDIVHTEFCSNHLRMTDHSPEQLVIQSLFGDGKIKYSARSTRPEKGLELIALKETIVPESQEAMTWTPSQFAMDMGLSTEVPQFIETNIRDYAMKLFASAGLSWENELERTVFAIHPGGPKIIDQVQNILEVSDRQTQWSREVLKSMGNLSSATIPNIWRKILEDSSVETGTLIFSVAFGPGLTVSGGLLRKCGS